jgi:hypothetical protein
MVGHLLLVTDGSMYYFPSHTNGEKAPKSPMSGLGVPAYPV